MDFLISNEEEYLYNLLEELDTSELNLCNDLYAVIDDLELKVHEFQIFRRINNNTPIIEVNLELTFSGDPFNTQGKKLNSNL